MHRHNQEALRRRNTDGDGDAVGASSLTSGPAVMSLGEPPPADVLAQMPVLEE